MNTAVVKQRWLRNGSAGMGGTKGTAIQGLIADFLDGFEAMPLGAFVFV
jgi:hypothetical protein